MDNAIVFDLIVAALLIVGFVVGAVRGLFKSLVGLVVVVAALLGAAFVANLVAEPVTEMLWPKIEEKMVSKFTEDFDQTLRTGSPEGEKDTTLGQFLEKYGIPEESRLRVVMEKLISSFSGISESVRDKAVEAYREAISESAKALLTTIVHGVSFLVAFILLLILLKLLSKLLDKVFDLPVLSTLNAVGGGLLGLIEAVLLLFLALWLARRLGHADWLDAHAQGTYLFHFFLTHTPKTLISILLNGR